MPEKCPSNATVFELGDGDLAGEGAVRLVEYVLRGDLDGRGEMLASEEKVECWGGDHYFGVGV